jgi:predicted dehydrogenase
MHTTLDNRLPFPTKPLVINGVEVEEYIIPEEKKRKVLEAMYPFIPLPSMDEVRMDIHSGKLFKIRQFRVTREMNQNWLVSPYYEEGGGTVIDWVPPDDEDFADEDELGDEE